MYQLIPILTIPPGRPPRIRMFPLPGGSGFRPTFFALGVGGFELEKFSTVLKEKCWNFSICFKETGGSLKSRCSCAFDNNFCKNISTVSLITYRHFSAISVVLIKFSGHPRVIFADARSSLKLLSVLPCKLYCSHLVCVKAIYSLLASLLLLVY